ncbi:MAG: hypothetical protein GY714_12550 [Desulfobacterales bacterium]|nr:hypothetical protein [Desulfobacterales bacterium]
MKKITIFGLCLVLFFGFFVDSAFAMGARKSKSWDCKTDYPILLVHGIATRDHTLWANYFGRIEGWLKKKGATVYLGEQNAWGSMQSNAKQLKKRILELVFFSDNKIKKFNVIAHSKGGLDIRRMLYDDPTMKQYIASFTTICTPHRGTIVADWFYKYELFAGSTLPFFRALSFIQGDTDIDMGDIYQSGLGLTKKEAQKFNNESGHLNGKSWNTAIPGIYCQSYTAKLKGYNVSDALFQITGNLMALAGDSPNDGMVTRASGQFGHYRGEKKGAWWSGGVAHMQMVDTTGSLGTLVPGFFNFDAPAFYADIVHELQVWEDQGKIK